MADVSDSKIATAYAAVRSDSDDTNWLLLGYENNKKIVLIGSGSGGVEELASHLKDDSINFGYVRVTNKDEETTRSKFVFLTWLGENAPVMRKGNASVHVANVKSVIKDYSLELKKSEISEVTEEAVLKAVKSANY
eukprot:TRINITY_DN1066_c0_g2_i1.p1 TRINITY_DN1066_c0_g2~~TRINITY_DN1066_c0_g2_i1.p1  ORF type:complete len:136 (+),score=39.99 TRINITY_DN1066_c0_g2_i1:40-447(+)